MDASDFEVELRPYHEHLAALREMAASPDWPADPRFRVARNIRDDQL
jgi:hypothetical protein